MSLVRVLGYSTLSCGCAVGHYREVATKRLVAYVEEKGPDCRVPHHRRNHTVSQQQLRDDQTGRPAAGSA